MKYEFRPKTLAGAVRKSLAKQAPLLERKFGVTIDAGLGRYERERISVFVEAGQR